MRVNRGETQSVCGEFGRASFFGRVRFFYLFGIVLAGMALSGCALLEFFKPVERAELPVPLKITMAAAERVNLFRADGAGGRAAGRGNAH
jgi:hypothetical protein